MAQITVKVRTDIGDPGVHHKFGTLTPGDKITMDEEDFGGGLFERPSPEWLSPHELADQARAIELKQRVGTFGPPIEEDPAIDPANEAPATGKKQGGKVQ